MMNTAEQLPLDFETRPALGREDFLAGPENNDAVMWVDRWPDWPAPVLIINGPSSSGKTHMAAVWRERTGAEPVKPGLLQSLGAEEIASKNQNLVFDGLDPWLGDREAETTLFHLYNMFKEQGGRHMLITMRMAPSQAEFAIADLASRLRAAPVATIRAPDDMLLGSILIKLFQDRQLRVNHDIIRYILPRMERSFSAAQDIVALADKLALAQKRKISVPLMRSVLETLQSRS